MKKPSPYDEAAREAAKMFDADAFLAWLMPKVAENYNRRPDWLDARQKRRTCDVVAGWTRKEDGSPLATVIEFLTRPNNRYLLLVADYVLDIRLYVPYQKKSKGKPQVPYRAVGLILLLTGKMRDVIEDDFTDLDLGEWHWKTRVIALAKRPAMATLERIAADELGRCVLPWVPLMKGGDEPAVMERWREVAMTEPNVTFRAQYGSLALIFADAAGRATMWEVALEGWSVKDVEGPLLQRWRADITKASEARGEVRGEANAFAQASRDLAELIEQQLQQRFEEGALAEARSRLKTADYATLRRWLGLTLQATSWAELRDQWDK